LGDQPAVLLYLLGHAYLALDRTNEARTAFERALEPTRFAFAPTQRLTPLSAMLPPGALTAT
jgi:hypothetical protein